MANKENKGGILKNDQVEQDLAAKGKSPREEAYTGSQDTGDEIVRQTGNEVQRTDGSQDIGQNEEA